ncbi:MAG: 23S rRNA (uracil(1939)-C(5))-methyltransferase RlmD [Bacteroidales bacterium]
MKHYSSLERLEIIDIADEGKSVAKYGDIVVFVTGAVPGDIVDAKVIKKRRNFLEAKIINFHKYSDDRIKPFCKHFGVCGGCKWQSLSYEKQLFYKQKQVQECLQRIAKIDAEGIILPIIPSANTNYYRNKLEYTFSCRRWLLDKDMQVADESMNMNGLGFHIPGMFDKVLDIETCYLQREPTNAIRLAVKEYALKNNLQFFDLRKQTGFLRNMIIRTTQAGEVMVIVSFFHDEKKLRDAILEYISNSFPEVTSLMYVINPKCNDVITDLEIQRYKGNPYIIETIGDLRFKIGPVSFFQSNTLQAYELYKTILDFAALSGNEIVYDLYTGTGTIANFVAASAQKVTGLEYIESAVSDAFENSRINGFSNTMFYAGDIAKVLNDTFVEANGIPDVVITDPPRSGMHKDVVQQLLEIHPQKIVYVSCNPSTQARDIALFSEKYDLVKSQPVDMFPHTHHIENVVLMVRRYK